MKVFRLESVFSVRRPSGNPLARATARLLLVTVQLALLPAGLLAAPAPADGTVAAGTAPSAAVPLSKDPAARPHPIPSFPRNEASVAAPPASSRSHLWAVASLALRSLKAFLAPQVGGGSGTSITREYHIPAGWTLVGVPLQPVDARPTAVFDELPTPLRVYDYVGGQVLGVDDPGFRNVAPGRAHWVLLGDAQTVSATGSLVSPAGPRTIPLAIGWNAISTPWLTAVPWSDARVSVRQGAVTRLLSDAVVTGWVEPDLHALLGGVTSVVPANTSPAGEMEAWQGYLFYSHVQGELVLSPPPPDTTPPTLNLSGLPDGTEISQPTPIVGTIDDPNLVAWTVEISAGSTSPFVPIASGAAPVTNGVLATLDPTLLENGLYVLRVTATDAQGNQSRVERTIVVAGTAKPGLFSLTFRDLEIPLAGIPVVVNRVYDSRARATSADFGFGWRVEIEGRGRYLNNRKPGDGWAFTSGFLPCQSASPTKSHVTEVRFSDIEVYRFTLQVTSPAPTLGGCFGRARFSQVGGLPGAQLNIAGNDEVFWQTGSGVLIEIDDFEVYEPKDVQLVTAGGRRYDLNLQTGLRKITDANGNSLTIGTGGLTHSSGRGVSFVRDGAGRIVQIVDPSGNAMSYAYTGGDLTTFTDREENTTTFAYSSTFPHLLERIDDPRGVPAIRAEFDESGRLIAQTDAAGNRVELASDVDGQRQVITDRLGAVRIFEYDARGNVLRETDPLGNVTVRTYDARDNVLTVTNPLGQTVTYTFDGSDNETSVRDELGNLTTHTYNARNQRLTTTDPRGKVTTNTYDSSGNLTAVRDPLGAEAHYSYAPNGTVLTATDTTGAVTRFQHDAAGNLIREEDPLGRVATFAYDANGNRLSETRTRTIASGTETLTTTFAYDKLDRLIQVTTPDGAVSRTEYAPIGLQSAAIDPLGRTTSFAYDELGQLSRTTFPDGTSEEKTYDAEGRPLSSKDGLGRVTTFQHDAAGRLTRITHPDGTFATTAYDGAGRIVAATDERGQATTFEYDAAGRRIRVRDPLGNETVTAYDPSGNQISVTDARNETTTFEYDDVNRRVRVRFPDGTDQRILYDAEGRRTAEIDQAGRTTQFTYDAAGRLATIVNALGQVTSFGYDEVGNRTTHTDANGRVTVFQYDRVGREVSRTLPDGKADSRTYDAAGNLRSRTDYRGRTIAFDYDAADRLVTRDYPDGSTVEFTYTPTGHRATVSDSRGATTYTYDARDRLAVLTYPDGRRLEYTYDPAGNRLSLTARVGLITLAAGRTYDAAGRLDVVTDPLGRAYDHGHDANGNRSLLVHPNGLSTSYQYDRLNRLTRLTTSGVAAGVLQSYVLTLGPAGTRARIDEVDGTVREYGYDALDRLTLDRVSQAGIPEYDKAFTHDPVGNRLTQTTNGSGAPGSPTGAAALSYVYDVRDRLVTDGLTAYEHDDNGNLATRLGDASYLWDFDDRLLRVQRADGTIVEHAYDADGNRVQTKVTPATGPPTTTNFLVDTSGALSHVIAETDELGNVRAYYVRGDDLLAVMRPDAAGPGGWETRFVHADALGSVRRLTDEAAQATDEYTYTAFGERITHTGTDPQPYAFAGEPYDPNAGFQYHRQRWMDPRAGRFVSVDPYDPPVGPMFDPPDLHRYLYASANPVNMVDPTGLMGMADVGASMSIRSSLSTQSTISARAVTLGINRTAGKALEKGIEQMILREFPGAIIKSQRALTGPGGKRVYDLLVKIGDKLFNIEVKTNIPAGGSAFRRLIGQIKTFSSPAQAEAAGAHVIVVSEKATEAALARVLTTLGSEGLSPHFVKGAFELVQLMRLLLLGV